MMFSWPSRAFFRRIPWCIIPVAVIVLFFSPRPSAAQTGPRPNPFLSVTPDSVLLTDQASTTTITLTNLQDTVRAVWLAPECPAGDYAMLTTWHYWWLTPLDPLQAAWRNASTCAAPWLTGYPRYVTLAPYERRTIPIQIIPPSTIIDGRYNARLIWAVELPGSYFHDEVNITYIKGPWHGPHWQPTPVTGPGSGVVEATPAVLMLDITSNATFTLRNQAATPTEVWLYVDCPWFLENFSSEPMSHQYELGWHRRIPNAALQIGGFPQHLVLAPHEQRTLPVELHAGMGEQRYARIEYVESPVRLGDTAYTTPSGGINVVVAPFIDRQRPQLAMSVLVNDDKDLPVACVTPNQDGVMTLHVELEDAQGRPVPANTWATRAELARYGRFLPAGGLDTTIVEWAEGNSDVPQFLLEGEDKAVPPQRVCFYLPSSTSLPSGHYQFVAVAYLLEDVTHSHPARVSAPLNYVVPVKTLQ